MTVKQIIRKECVSKTKESGIWNQKFKRKMEKKRIACFNDNNNNDNNQHDDDDGKTKQI